MDTTAPAPTHESPPVERKHPTWQPGQPGLPDRPTGSFRPIRLGRMSHNELRRVVRTQGEQLTALQTIITKLEDRLRFREGVPVPTPEQEVAP